MLFNKKVWTVNLMDKTKFKGVVPEIINTWYYRGVWYLLLLCDIEHYVSQITNKNRVPMPAALKPNGFIIYFVKIL